MKRIFALVLALTMVLSMTACGGASDVRGDVQTAAATEPRGTVEATEPEEASVSMGTSSGNVYTNQFLGLGCKLGEEWTFLSEEEILANNQMTNEMVAGSNEELAKKMENSPSFMDMMAMVQTTGSTVNVTLENLGLVYGTVIDEDKYLELGTANLDEAMAAIGVTNMQVELVSVPFAGTTAKGYRLTGEIEGTPLYQTAVCWKVGKYMAFISSSSFFEDTTMEALNGFYTL